MIEDTSLKIKEDIDSKKEFYNFFIDFIENEDESINPEIINQIEKLKKSASKADKILMFCIILNIFNNHQRNNFFKIKIINIFKYLADILKQTMTNSEMFNFFKSNKLIILYLIENKIIDIDEQIIKEIQTEKAYCHFLYPEIAQFLKEDEKEEIKKEMLLIDINIFDEFDKKRKEGENDDYICSLIRNDNIDEFISYLNQKNISLSIKIKRSIFETNLFLIDKEPTMIEYAIFFGSTRVFNYLINNGVKLNSSIWEYAIHSNNAEIIDIILNKNIKPIDETYIKCFEESIKCHHNEVANYIQENLLTNQSQEYFKIAIQNYNYLYLPHISMLSSYFYELYICKYSMITKYLIEEMEKNLIEKQKNLSDDLIFNQMIQEAANKNDTIEIYLLLSKRDQIKYTYFKMNDYLTKIIIPNTITSIDEESFNKCSSLTQVSIPSSVNSIKKLTFSKCSKLTQVVFEFPSSITSIGNYAFSRCLSLTQITIPSSVTSIENDAFSRCSSLKHITIPFSVTKIGNDVFFFLFIINTNINSFFYNFNWKFCFFGM